MRWSAAKSKPPSTIKCRSGSRSQTGKVAGRAEELRSTGDGWEDEAGMSYSSAEKRPEKDGAERWMKPSARCRYPGMVLSYFTPATLVDPVTSMKIGLL